MRTLAIDLGTRRVGLALGDSIAKIATPYEVLNISTPEQALEAVARTAREESVEQFVVGVPLNMDDSAGSQAKQAVAWGKRLGELTGLPLVFVDERLSSFAAEQQLIERKRSGEKLTHGRKKRQLDALAAASFLQQFLDGTLAPLNVYARPAVFAKESKYFRWMNFPYGSGVTLRHVDWESSMMMTCFEADANLPKYFAGKLSKAEREGLRSHLAACSGCAERAAEIGDAAHMIRDCIAELPDPVAGDVPEPLLRAVMTLVASGSSAGPSTFQHLEEGF